MAHQVTIELPEGIYQCATRKAETRGQPLETVLVDALRDYWLVGITADDGLETATEKRDFIALSIEAANWWNTEGDKEWDKWQP